MNRQQPKTILVVDDQAVARKTIRQMLEYCGYSVLEAADGKEGLALAVRDQDSIGLVLLGLTLPDLSGEEMLRRLRVLGPQLKVAVCTDQSVAELKRKTEYREIAGVLRKPVRTDRLLAIVRQTLGAGREPGSTRG